MVKQIPESESQTDKRLLARLSLEEKVALLTGLTHWALAGAPQIELRPTVVSDGPAGARGVHFDDSRPATSLPAPVGLGATWDVETVRELAAALGAEARSRGVHLLLAPTVNLVRTPLGGRDFEFFSEDPWLTTRIGSAYVAGVQSAGVGTCIKHYVANDSETERKSYDARISETVLRELYLLPFEVCIHEAHPTAVMAAYNQVNGSPMTENRRLLREVLKEEWGYDGLVMSDWTATWSTEASALSGLDVVMPGPDGPWGSRLVAAVRAGRVPETEIDDKVVRILRLARRLGTLGPAPPEASPSQELTTVDPALVRRATPRTFVLLRNREGALPLVGAARRRIALIGPAALWPRTQGGGSVTVLAAEGPTLVEALRAAVGTEGEVEVMAGCRFSGPVPAPLRGSLTDPRTGEPGIRLEVRGADGALLYDRPHPRTAATWWDDLPDAVHAGASTVILHGRYRAGDEGPHLIGAAGLGRLSVEVDGVLLAEATTVPPPELVGLLARPPEVRVPLRLHAGQEVEIRFVNQLPLRLEAGREVEARDRDRPRAQPSGPRLVLARLGIAPAPDEETLLREAEEAARRASACVVVVGLGEDADSEGFDRDSLGLPGRQDELVRRVAAANPRTVVVVNAGSPALMPWVESVAAVLQVWLPGQAMPEALADVLLGAAEPSGRLPISLPRGERDCPVLSAEPHFGALEYSEGLLIGYRGYDRNGVDPLFCFGHGLGYTEWEYVSLDGAEDEVEAGADVEVTVTVRNTGGRTGREVVQLYLERAAGGVPTDGQTAAAARPADEPERPLRILAAFASVAAGPGETATATLTVPARAFARYDAAAGDWTWPRTTWSLRAGRSSRDLRLTRRVRVR
jgi:beta-glucosidase